MAGDGESVVDGDGRWANERQVARNTCRSRSGDHSWRRELGRIQQRMAKLGAVLLRNCWRIEKGVVGGATRGRVAGRRFSCNDEEEERLCVRLL